MLLYIHTNIRFQDRKKKGKDSQAATTYTLIETYLALL